MKVKELIDLLSKFDPSREVFGCTEDERFLKERIGFVLFDVQSVQVTHAEQTRLEDGTPYFKIGRGPNASELVTLEMTADF